MRVRPRVGPDKPIVVGHFNFRQAVLVGHEIVADDAVQVQDISGHRIDLVGRQHVRGREWHGAVDIIEQCGGIGPIGAHGRLRPVARECTLAGYPRIPSGTFAERSMTCRAHVGVQFIAVLD